MQALATANTHTALRNGLGFLLQKRGKILEWPELCTGTHFPPTHRLLFVLSCNDFENTHKYSRLPSCLPTEDVPIQPCGARRGGLVTPPCHGGDMTPEACLSSGSRVLHMFLLGAWITQHWGAVRWAEPRGWVGAVDSSTQAPLLAFFTIPLFSVLVLA